MTRLIAGADIGGTKTHIRTVLVEAPASPVPVLHPLKSGTPGVSAGEVVADLVTPSDGWQPSSPAKAAGWLAERLPPGDLAHLAVGAQACETPAHCEALAVELRALLGVPVTVVNDAELLVPAAGLYEGVGVIAGTGSIAVGRHAVTGEYLSAGGWGWVLGDEGSASALVREAAKAVLSRADEGAEPDALARALLRSYEVAGLPELAAAMSWDSGVETWGAHAPAVFAAAEAGSPLAEEVITAGGRALARLVALLAARGAAADAVVVAGGVITARAALMTAFETELSALLPGTEAHLLDEPPVSGAIELARRAVQP
jgi:N-acetylglucosamine kinase-like BadF-type ATPase